MAKPDAVSRRSVLRSAGLAVTATMFPRAVGLAKAALQENGRTLQPGQTRADFPVSDVMRRLSTYMSEARDRALPDEVSEHARRHILDTFAAMVSGAELRANRQHALTDREPRGYSEEGDSPGQNAPGREEEPGADHDDAFGP